MVWKMGIKKHLKAALSNIGNVWLCSMDSHRHSLPFAALWMRESELTARKRCDIFASVKECVYIV